MKKSLFIGAVFALSGIYGTLSAQNTTQITAGGIRYSVVGEGGAKSLEVIGAEDGKDMAIPPYVSMTDGTVLPVTRIGEGAFRNAVGLQSVTLPSELREIGREAFAGCTGLKDLSLPAGIDSIGSGAFSGCSGLLRARMPLRLHTIAEGLFRGCLSLKYLRVPEGVSVVAGEAFAGCSSLHALSLPSTLVRLQENALEGCRIDSLWQYALTPPVISDARLTGLSVSALLMTAPGASPIYGVAPGWKYYKVEDFDAIRTFTVADVSYRVVSLSPREVEVASARTVAGDVSIPSTIDYGNYSYQVTGVGDRAFSDNASLTSVMLSATVRRIGNEAFSECRALVHVQMPASLVEMGENAFVDCRSLAAVSLPDGLGRIAYNAFSGCSALSALVLPARLLSLEAYSLMGCSALTTLRLPDSCQRIGDFAFMDCSSLLDVTLSKGLTSIGDEALTGCEHLGKLYVSSSSPVLLSALSLDGMDPQCVIYVPEGSRGNYASADYWKDFSIQEWSRVDTFSVAGLSYRVLSQTRLTAEVTGWKGARKASLVVPSSVDNDGQTYQVTGVADSAFAETNEQMLTSASLPEGLVRIGQAAFSGCHQLQSLSIPSSVRELGSSSFDACSSWTGEVTAPEGVTAIPAAAFRGCRALTAVHLPASLRQIDAEAFRHTSLKELDLPYLLSGVGPYALADMKLQRIAFPESTVSLGIGALADDSLLTDVKLSSRLAYVPPFLFHNATSLTSFELPAQVYSLGRACFAGCRSLLAVNLPAACLYYGDSILNRCPALRRFLTRNLALAIMTPYSFYGMDRQRVAIYVPQCAYGDYLVGDYWKEFHIYHFVLSGIEGKQAQHEVRLVQYFDLSGRRVSSSFRGIVIRRTFYEDGEVTTVKMMVR